MRKISFYPAKNREKTSIVIFSLFLTAIISLMQKGLNLVSVFFLLILSILVFFRKKKPSFKLYEAVDNLEFVSFITAVTALIFTGSFNSPFIPSFFGIYYSITRDVNPFISAASGAIAFFILYAASIVLGHDLSSPDARLSMMLYLALVFLVSTSAGKGRKRHDAKIRREETFSTNQKERLVENLRSVLDLIKKLSYSADENEVLENYFRESPLCPPVCRIMVFYRPEERAVLYEYKLDTERLTSHQINIPYQIERSRVPERIFDENSNEFLLSAHNEFLAIYHDRRTLGEVDRNILSLIDSVFSEIFLATRFATYRSHLLEKISATKEFLRELSYSGSFNQIFESAAISLKKISGAQKTFFLPFADSESEVFARAIFKGPMKLLPQKLWEQELLKMYRKMVTNPEPLLLARDSLKIFAAPVRKNNGIYGILGGITDSAAKTENSLMFAEFIAGIASMSLSSITTSHLPGKARKETNDKTSKYLYELRLLLEEIIYILHNRLTDKNYGFNKDLSKAKELIEEQLVMSLAPDDALSAGKSLSILVSKISDMFGRTGRFEIKNLVDESVDFDRSFFAPVATFLIEAVLNSILHSKSRNITVSLFKEDGKVHLKVVDYGVGFELSRVVSEAKKSDKHLSGLKKMALSARKINAKMKIKSKLNQGTEVELLF